MSETRLDEVFPIAATYWIGLVPLVVGVLGMLFSRRFMALVERYRPMGMVEPKSRLGKFWVKYAGLSGEGPAWERVRFGFVFLVFALFAVMGLLAVLGEWNPYD